MSEFTFRGGDEVSFRRERLLTGRVEIVSETGIVVGVDEPVEGVYEGELLVRLAGDEKVRVLPRAVRKLTVLVDDEVRCHSCGRDLSPNFPASFTHCTRCREMKAHILGAPMLAKSILRSLDDERVTEPVSEVGSTSEAF